jgi:hypothetical protein
VLSLWPWNCRRRTDLVVPRRSLPARKLGNDREWRCRKEAADLRQADPRGLPIRSSRGIASRNLGNRCPSPLVYRSRRSKASQGYPTLGSRDLYFQIEHRRNDITPFLFSFAADGVAVEAPPESGSIFGGVTLMHVLWKKNETGSLSLKVDPKNILALIGDRKFSELSIVAAFCERRQEDGTGSTVGWIEGLDHMPVLAGTIPPISVDESGTETPFPHRPVLIRSHAVKLGYYDGKWSLKKE